MKIAVGCCAATTVAISTMGYHVHGVHCSLQQLQKDVEKMGEEVEKLGNVRRMVAREMGFKAE